MITLDQLRRFNRTRQNEWPGNEEADLAFRALEFADEAGEVAGAVKKYLRAERLIHGELKCLSDIEDEIGDALISLDLLADELGIDIGHAAAVKFNKTSEKYGLKTKIDLTSTTDAEAEIKWLREIAAESRFLVDRLAEFQADACQCEESVREWNGHVTPPLARLKLLLARSVKKGPQQ